MPAALRARSFDHVIANPPYFGAGTGTAAADATSFTLKAAIDDPQYKIAENKYLTANASSVSYEVTITLGDGTWGYAETTMLRMTEFPQPFAHTDKNTLRRVG